MKLHVVIIGEDNPDLASLRQEIETEPDFEVEHRLYGFQEANDLLHMKANPLLMIIDLNRDAESAFRISQQIKFENPKAHLILTSTNTDPETILRAMRSGAEEFLTQPFNWPDVLQSLQSIKKKIHLHSPNNNHGRIITIFSNKGGVGSTTIATNLAVALASRKQKLVCIVDLVLQFGSVAGFLNLEPIYTLADLARSSKQIDPMMLDGSLIKHSTGVRVLAEPSRPTEATRIEPSHIEQILDALVQPFDFVIVDAPKELDDIALISLEKADLIFLVAEMNVPALKSLNRAMEFFVSLGMEKKIRIIVNRYVKSKLISPESVEKTVGIKIFWTLPNDYPVVIAALNQGLSIQESDPKSEIARSYQGLADVVMDLFSVPKDEKLAAQLKKRGILARLMSH